MPKRKQPPPDPDPEEGPDTPSKRRRKTRDVEVEVPIPNGYHLPDTENEVLTSGTPNKQSSVSRATRRSAVETLQDKDEEQDEGTPTPKVNGRTLFATPSKAAGHLEGLTPSRSVKAKADQSARRKSARLLAEAQNNQDEDEDFEGQDTRLAREILEDNGEEAEEEDGQDETGLEGPLSDNEETATPSKKPSNRRTRAKTRIAIPTRSPTPEGDIPPEERYFYQNRPGPPQVSDNRFNSVKLLTQDEYLQQMSSRQEHHEPEKKVLLRFHARSFPQWKFELDEQYGICLYGYGSKRKLVSAFAEWLYKTAPSDKTPRIVMVNGYTPKLNIRAILNTVASAVAETENDEAIKLTGQPEEMLDALLAHLTSMSPQCSLHIMVNSIDSPTLRRPQIQPLLSRLSAHPAIKFLCTADIPSFALQWTSSHLDQFRFVYHDCTTFARYDVEIPNVVDDVHELLGRKRMRAGGKDGVGFVLKSLPENARNLYRLLLTEILALMDDGAGDSVEQQQQNQDDLDSGDDDDDLTQTPSKKKKKPRGPKPPRSRPLIDVSSSEDLTVPYRTLYRKASEEFICSSSMNFQFLLKEFLDHQMIFARRDERGGNGAEMLGVPLGRAEIEGVLEGLI